MQLVHVVPIREYVTIVQELEELLCQLAAPMNSVVTTIVDQARGMYIRSKRSVIMRLYMLVYISTRF